ncbi:CehA/McbA family metallohydrolase [Paenibacillus xerothermodurans]|uniref:Phosphoesterase n=1 Tax=Paenibacillus xerothermodurans TaxID=1977292 RepID=A0A2W1P1F1_PAEXE|nr:CehA/McbA family metallohydrolase [Paenibacillus xerothermodurans]PZE21572.1 phosphoesterase [Paenibacillus xerothermodurans]
MKQLTRESMQITAARWILHEEQSTYLEIPFTMPEHVEEIHVSYEVKSPGKQKAVIDLGIRDGSRVRGWSGGARTEFTLGLEKATPGYIPGQLHAGEWAVLHNAYKVPDEGCEVAITLQFCFASPRWLKGDLHTHSIHSDGTFTLEANASIMEVLGCDFIAMTDHNTSSQNFAYPRNTNVVMIPGMEFTTNFGHSNFLGSVDPLDDFRVSDQKDVEDRIRTARQRGAKIVLNHPHCDHCPWEWDFQVEHDWVEVWNGPWKARNARTLAWWQHQLESGRRMVAVGGSDVHREGEYVRHAVPCTWVLASAKTSDDILRGIAQGRVFITYSPEGPFVEFTCGCYQMGDMVPASEADKRVFLRCADLKPGDLVKLISENGVEREVVITQLHNTPPDVIMNGSAKQFVRAEIWRYFKEMNAMLPLVLTNPIYFEK